MKLRIAKLLIIFLFFNSSLVSAESSQSFNIDIAVTGFPDTVFQNQLIGFDITLTNNDTSKFDDKLYINYMITDTMPGNFPDDLKADFKDSISVIINQGNVYLKNQNLTINPIFFEGNKKNIIIIWPTATTINIEFNMYMQFIRVEWPLGMELNINSGFIVYPNPSSAKTRIELPDDMSEGIISIYSTNGALNREIVFSGKPLYVNFDNTNNEGMLLPDGIYFVVIRNDRKKYIQKLIISR